MAKSAIRALQIMEHVSQQREGCSHAELAQALSIPKSSLTGLLRDLTSNGYLQQNRETGAFHIGMQVLALANSYLQRLDIVHIGQPVVRELFDEVQEFASLSVQSGLDYLLVCSEAAPTLSAHKLHVGHRAPLFCSAGGKAMLAYMAPSQRDAILQKSDRKPLTPFTRTDLEDIRRDLEEIRERGVSFSREEVLVGINAVSAPILNSSGFPIAAVSIAMPSQLMDDKRRAEIEDAVKRAARKLCRQFGWSG
jgi:DNA-binding IclR family transcriptional regulator